MKLWNPYGYLQMDPRNHFLFIFRLWFGVWLAFVGLMKWLGGPAGFIGHIQEQFAATWVPGILVLIMAWGILIAEPLLGLWLITGKCQRLAWLATAKLMFLLLFGMTILKNYQTVSQNWIYCVFAIAAASLSDPCCGEACCPKSKKDTE
jgi:hypothetical protein